MCITSKKKKQGASNMQNPNLNDFNSLYQHIEQIFKNNKNITTFSQFFKINKYNEKQSTSESLWIEGSNEHLLDNVSISSFVKDMSKIWKLEDPSSELSERIHTKYKNIFSTEYENTKYQLASLRWDAKNNWIILDYFELPDLKNVITKINKTITPKNNVLNIYTNTYADQLTNIKNVDLRYKQDENILNNVKHNTNLMTHLFNSLRIRLFNSTVIDMFDLYNLDDTKLGSATSKWNRFIKTYSSNEMQDKTQIIISDLPLQSELKDANIPAISLPLNYFI